MSSAISAINGHGLLRISGTISNLKVKRDTASFVFTQSDQSKLGVIAIAASFAGLSGQAIGTASNASSVEEEADYLEFVLNGQSVKGWVWRNPFREGDVVTIAAENKKDYFEAFGILRNTDKTIALFPHCSRGKVSHGMNAVKWWLIGGGGTLVALYIPLILFIGGLKSFFEPELWWVVCGAMIFFALMTYSLTRKWMPFVRLAEKVFRALELPNPSNVDLVKSSKAQRTDKDPGEFGTFYFRY
jgi:hypothetical protein